MTALVEVFADVPPDTSEAYDATKKHVDGEAKKAKERIENVVSPRLQTHNHGRCIAISSIFGQMVLFVGMMLYFTTYSCTVMYTTLDGDWGDDTAYDGYFASNIKLCSTEVYMVTDSPAADYRDSYTTDAAWALQNEAYDLDDDAGVVLKEWAPLRDQDPGKDDNDNIMDTANIYGVYYDCHIAGKTCDDYFKGQPCGTPSCDDTRTCYGQLSVKYALCNTFAEAVPLATGYLVYANMAFVTFCLCCFGLIKCCQCKVKEAVGEVAYQLVGVIGDRELPKSPAEIPKHTHDDKGEVEMMARP